MDRFWKAIYSDGTVVTERETHWNNVEVDRIVSLSIVHDGHEHSLPPGMGGWIQAKTATVEVGGNPEIQSRYVGFMSQNSQIVLRVMENTGDCVMEFKETV